MNEKPTHFNFPVQLLSGAFDDLKNTLDNILCYCLFEHTAKLKLGNSIEKFIDAAEYYGVNLFNREKSSFNKGFDLWQKTPDNSPKVGISLPMYWEFANTTQSQFDIACLMAFLAIKSILGKDDYCKTNNLLLWSRMDGKVKSVNYTGELSPLVQKFCNDYQIVKIKNELCRNWGLVTYSRHTKGFYVTFKLDLFNLTITAEKARKTSKEKERKQIEREIIKQALKTLNTG